MTDKMKIIEYVLENNTKEDSDWKCYSNAGSYDGNDVDERWTREVHAATIGFYYKESVRLVGYGNMGRNMVNVQYSVFSRERENDNWKFLTGHDDGVMTLEEARGRYIK